MRHEKIYLDPSDPVCSIETYVVNDRTHLREAMLVIPGGGYSVVCTDREGEPIALDFLARDMNVFVLNYHVSGDRTGTSVYPAPLIDASRAIVYIRRHADAFGIDPHKIYCVGFSAGGHLAGMLATLFGDPAVESALGIRHGENRPDGAILGYPVVTLHGITHSASFENLLGKAVGDITDDEREKFSLDTAVTDETAPCYIWHTVTDDLVPVHGSLLLCEALRAHRIPCELHVFPWGPHGLARSDRSTDGGNPALCQPAAADWTAEATAFLRSLPGA